MVDPDGALPLRFTPCGSWGSCGSWESGGSWGSRSWSFFLASSLILFGLTPPRIFWICFCCSGVAACCCGWAGVVVAD